MSNLLHQYIGPQSFWNAHSVNSRERYYYGYGGYYGDGVEPKRFYRTMPREPIQCDALTQDCWSRPRDTINDWPLGCQYPVVSEGFGSSNNFGVLGIVGIVTVIVLLCKNSK